MGTIVVFNTFFWLNPGCRVGVGFSNPGMPFPLPVHECFLYTLM